MRELEDWIERLDEIIEELGLEIARLTAKMQQHFDNAHEAEDLLEDIQDGISEEERQRIVALLGPEAVNGQKELTHFATEILTHPHGTHADDLPVSNPL